MSHRRTWIAVLAGLTVLLLAANATALAVGLDDDEERPEAAAKPPPPPGKSIVAGAIGRRISIYAAPGAPAPSRSLSNPNENGAPLVFLVKERQGDWLHVLLPVRPNGSTGWIRASDVKLGQHSYRILIELSAHRITVFDGPNVLLSEPVGVGTRATPTPGGNYYIKELLRPPTPNGPYGTYAYGLSGFSNQLTSFAGGEGVIGIHGTNDPSSIGKDVSFGCIRMSNAGINKLAARLPLGTPVEIRP
ncbi:MAG: L,D-transpeptidase [Actinomycetota bacterium]|nr:L,D-transpeptidase [Actinomycetota bacterium]